MGLRLPLRRPHSCARRSLFWEENWNVPAEHWTHQIQLRIDGVWSISNRNWNNRSFLFPAKEKEDVNTNMRRQWLILVCTYIDACFYTEYVDVWFLVEDKLKMCTGDVYMCTWKWDERQGVSVLLVPSVRQWWWGILVFLVLGTTRLGVWVNVWRRLIGIRNVILKQIRIKP